MELAPQAGAQETAMNSNADVTVYGGAAGAGKSHLMLLRAGVELDDPNFNCIFFRRNGTQLRGAGGLWQEAKKLYAPWNPKIQETEMRMTFESGAIFKFNHMEHEKNKTDHQGLQYSAVYFDEGTHFEESQVTYLMSRLRSEAEVDSHMFISCNPDPDSFLLDWIEWWIDEEGYPIPERSGVVRYYITPDEKPVFRDTPEELIEEFPDLCRVENPRTGQVIEIPPKSFTFISATIFDNPALIEKNPKYLAELKALSTIERARLLDGNWRIRPEGASHFQRSWIKKAMEVPAGSVQARAWDKASSAPSDVEKWPDFTACSPKIAKCKDGNFYLTGDYHVDNFDRHTKEYTNIFGRFREGSGQRDLRIKDQAIYDGVDVTVVLTQDPGAAGVTEYTESAKKLIMEGITVKKDPMPTQNSKLTRFLPFSSACELGIVYVVEHTFHPETLKAFYEELEAFDGSRSTRRRKDDYADATASCFNFLCKKAVIPSFSLADFKRVNPF